jgi:hypothetical protein
MRLSTDPIGSMGRDDKDEELADLLLTLHDVWSAVGSLSLRQQAILLLRFAEEISRTRIVAWFRPRTEAAEPQLFRVTSKLEESQ